MKNLKNHFRLNGKTFDELSNPDKIILSKILNSVSDIAPLLEESHYMDFGITDKQSSKFDFNLPDSVVKRVIEVCIISKNS